MRLLSGFWAATVLVPALVLAGCGVEKKLVNALDVDSPEVVGRAIGGSQPISDATIEVVEMGTGGYGSAGTVLKTTTTDSGGNFSFAPGSYTCPQSNTPVYLLGIGGNTGAGTNSVVVLGAGLGACATAPNAFVIMNEVTTVGLAFSLAQFFTTTRGGTPGTNDWFGGPSTGTAPSIQYSKGLVMGNSVTIPTIVFNAIGAPHQSGTFSSGTAYAVEWEKINTIANILLACVNTQGSTAAGTKCGTLFTDTANGGTAPSDTLQAAVQMALHPASNVAALYGLITATAPTFTFTPYLAAAPNDWTIGVSYSTSALGLGVNTGTLSTLDIDASGRVWFPSNAAGKIGAAYFDPTSQSFNGPFNSGLVHPQQVAIDSAGYAWYNDNATDTVAGFLTTNPTMTQSLSLAPTTSTSVAISGDDRIYVGVTNGSTYQLGEIPAARGSYALFVPLIGTNSFAHPLVSIAGDVGNGAGIATSDPGDTALQDYLLLDGLFSIPVDSATDADSGQVTFTGGTNYVSVLSGPTTGTSNDGLCPYSSGTCHTINAGTKHALQGMALDGNSSANNVNLWVSESANGGVLQILANNATANPVPATEFLHGTTGATGGGTATATTPYGIGIDATGNVWMTNAGCTTTGCAPGNFTLTEIVGAGGPTITPVSAQITNGSKVGTRPTN